MIDAAEVLRLAVAGDSAALAAALLEILPAAERDERRRATERAKKQRQRARAFPGSQVDKPESAE